MIPYFVVCAHVFRCILCDKHVGKGSRVRAQSVIEESWIACPPLRGGYGNGLDNTTRPLIVDD
jgi:hypothetical protein